MTDRELLEKAAKAAGYQVDQRASFMTWRESRKLALLNSAGGHTLWNPLTDDGDALRLAVKLRIDIEFNTAMEKVYASNYLAPDNMNPCAERFGSDPHAATRRAIVRAAAAMGARNE